MKKDTNIFADRLEETAGLSELLQNIKAKLVAINGKCKTLFVNGSLKTGFGKASKASNHSSVFDEVVYQLFYTGVALG